MQDKRLKKQYSRVTDPEKRIFGRTIKLVEEVGELCSEILAHKSLQRKDKLAKHDKENLPGEFADVIITTLLVAKSMNIDVPKALEEKTKKINKRYRK